MNRAWSNAIRRLFNSSEKMFRPNKHANQKKLVRVRPPLAWLTVEHLEDRSVPATGITVINGASGAGDLDTDVLTGTVTAAEVTAAAQGTISLGALEAVAATTSLSITSPGAISFNTIGGTATLLTKTGFTDTFNAGGAITFANTSDTFATSGGGLTFDVTGTGNITLANLNSVGGGGGSGVTVATASGQINTAAVTAVGLSANATGNITIGGAVASSGAVTLTTSAGAIGSGSNIIQTSSQLSLSANQGINVMSQAVQLTATNSGAGAAGNISVTQTASPQQSLTIVGAGVQNTVSSGTISITDLGSAIALSPTVSIVSNNGAITLTASDVQLNGTINSGTATTTLAPTAGTQVDLGTNTINKFGVTQAEIDAITAGNLRIGANNSGAFVVSKAITVNTASEHVGQTLTLISGGGITDTAGAGGGGITATNLRLSGTGSSAITLDSLGSGNNVVNLAADVNGLPAGNLFFTDETHLLTIGVVDGDTGINSVNGNVTLEADTMAISNTVIAGTGIVTFEPFTTAQAISVGTGATGLGISNAALGEVTAGVVQIGNTSLNHTGAITIDGNVGPHGGFNTLALFTGNTTTNALVTDTTGAITESGAFTITVANLLADAVGAVQLTNNNVVSQIAGATTGSSALGDNFRFVDTPSGTLTVGTVDGVAGISTGNDFLELTTTGALTLTNGLTTGATGAIGLSAGGAVTQGTGSGAAITTGVLELLGTGPYTLTNTNNSVGTIAASVTSAVSYTNAGALVIGSLNFGDGFGGGAISGISNAGAGINAAISVNTVDGALTVSNAVNAGSSTVSLTAGSVGGDHQLLDVEAAVTGNGGVMLTADNMTINAAVTAGTAAGTSVALLQNFTAGQQINLGGADSANTLGLTSTEIDNVTAGILRIGRNDTSAAGNIAISAQINPTGTHQLELLTGGSITGTAASPELTVTRLGMTAGTGIGTSGSPITTTVSNLEAATTSGGVFVANTGTLLTIGGVNAALTGITAGGGNIVISSDTGLTTSEGVTDTGSGNISLTNTSAAADLTLNAAVAASGGNGSVSLTSARSVLVNAAVSTTGTGSITAETDSTNSLNGDFVSTTGGTLSTQGGSITIQGGTDGKHGHDATIGDAVTITGGTGSVGVSVANNVNANAAIGVTGSGGITLTADGDQNGSGNFTSNASGTLSTKGGAITVFGVTDTFGAAVNVTNGAGNITVQSEDNLNVNAPFSITGTGKGAISLTADVGVAGTKGNDGVGAFTSNASGTLSTVGGSISVVSAQDATIGAAVTITGGTGGVSITSQNNIFDNAPIAVTGMGTITATADSLLLGHGNFTNAATDTLTTNGGGITIFGVVDTFNAGVTVNGGSGDIIAKSEDNMVVNAPFAVTTGGTGGIFLTADVGVPGVKGNDGVGSFTSTGTLSTTGGNITVASAQDATIGAAVTITGGTGSVSLSSQNNVLVNAPVSVTGSGGITAEAASSNNLTGNFTSNSSGTLTTNGGAITIQGGVNQQYGHDATIGAAVTINGGTGSVLVSIANNILVNAPVSVTGSGSITMTADSDKNGSGNFTNAASDTLSTKGGAINVFGVVDQFNAAVTVTGGAGSITVQSEDSTTVNAPFSVTSGGTGGISITADVGVSGAAGNNGVGFFTSTSSGTLSTVGGSISVTSAQDATIGAAVTVTGGTGSVSVSSQNNVLLNAPVAVAGTGTGNISVTADSGKNGTGNVTSNSSGTLSTQGGAISVYGVTDTFGAAVTVTGGAGGITVQSEDTTNVNAAFSVTGTGGISFTADVGVPGAKGNDGVGAFTSTTGGTLSTNGGSISIVSAQDATIGDKVTLTGGAGNVSISSQNNVLVNAAVAVAGTGTGTITVTGDSDQNGSGNVTSNSSGTLSTQGGAIGVYGVTDTFGAAVTVTGGNGGITVQSEDTTNVNAAFSVTGTGSISFTADGGVLGAKGSDGVGAFTSTSGGTLSTAGGTISIVSAQDATIGDKVTVTGGAGNVSITSQNNVLVNAAVAVAGTGTGTITVTGDSDQNGSGNVTSNASGTLSTKGGGISVYGVTDTFGAAVTVTGGAGNIAVQSEDTTNVNAPFSVTGSGGISFTADVGVAGTKGNDGVGAFTSTTGGTLSTNGGSISIVAAQDATIGDNVTVTGGAGNVSITSKANVKVNGTTNVTGTGGINITADSAGTGVGAFSNTKSLTTNGGNIVITAADAHEVGAAINATTGATSRVEFLGSQNSTVFHIGSDTAFGLTAGELGFITAGVLQIGSTTNTGGISVDGAVTLSSSNVPVLSLETGGTILQNGGSVAVQSLALRSGTGIGGGTPLQTAVTNLALTNSTSGPVAITNTSTGLNITTVDGVTGATNVANGLTINQIGGPIDIQQNVHDGGGGAITLTTSGANGNITLESTATITGSGGNGNISLDASAATSGGQITINGTSPPTTRISTDTTAGSTGIISLLAHTGVTIGAGTDIQAGNAATGGNIVIESNAMNAAGANNITFGANTGLFTIANINLNAAPNGTGGGAGGAITLTPTTVLGGPGGGNAFDINLTAGQDVTVSTMNASDNITVTTAANIVSDNVLTNVMTAGNNITLTAGRRIGGNTPLTPTDIQSAATMSPSAAYLAMINVNYGGKLFLNQTGAEGNVQIRDLNPAGLNLSTVVIGNPLVGVAGDQLALVSVAGDLTDDTNFIVPGSDNADLFLATVNGHNVVFPNTTDSIVNNANGTALTTIMASGSSSAAIVTPVPNGTANVTAQNLRLVTTGGAIGTVANPFEFNATTLNGFTNGDPDGVTPATGGSAYLTDTLNGISVGQFNAGTGDVVLKSLGQIQTGLGTGSSIISSNPNSGVAAIIGKNVTLDTTAATASGATGQIGYFTGGAAQFFEVQASGKINATTNNSRVWISAINGGQVGSINVGNDTAVLKTVNGNLLGSQPTTATADVTAGGQVILIGSNGGFGNNITSLQINSPILNANVTSGTGNIDVLGINAGGLTVNAAKTVSGSVDVGTTLGNLQIGSATATGTVVSATGTVALNTSVGDVLFGTGTSTGPLVSTTGEADIVANGNITDNAPTGVVDVVAATLGLTAGAAIGSSGSPVTTQASTLAAGAGTGGVFVTNTGNLTIGTASTGSGVTGNGTIAVTTAGSLTVAQSVMDSGANNVTLTTTAAASGNNLTVNTGASVMTGSGGNVNLMSGNNVTVNGSITTSGAGIITIAGDTGNSGTGTTITLSKATNLNAATTALINGNSDADTFNLTPQTNVKLAVTGGLPTTAPGDTLKVTGDTGTALNLASVGAGTFTFTNGQQIAFTGIEGFSTATPFALNLNLATLGFHNNANPDVVNISTTAGATPTLNVTVQGNSTGTPTSVFSGAASSVSSLTVVGSNDSESANVDETNPGIPTATLQAGTGANNTLNINTTNVSSTNFIAGAPGSGTYLFGNRNSVAFSGFQSVTPSVISVVASLPNASKRGTNQTPQPGQFTFTRTGNLSSALTVAYNIGGTAINGVDYQAIGFTVTFAAGSATAVVNINVLDNSLHNGTRTVVVSLFPGAGYTFSAGASATVSIADNHTAASNARYATAAAVTGAIQVFDGNSTNPTFSFIPYPGYQGALAVAVGDVNGDGVPDFATAVATAGAPAAIKVFDGATGAEILSFIAFPGYQGGLSIALGDFFGNGHADIVVGTLTGSPTIAVFDGLTGAPISAFSMFPGQNLPVGVNVAVGDFNADGKVEIVAGLRGLVPHVKVFDIAGNTLSSFYAFDPALGISTGVTVSAGNLTGSGPNQIIVGAVVNGQNIVNVLGVDGTLQKTLPLPPASPPNTISSFGPPLATADLGLNGKDDILVTIGPVLDALDGTSFGLISQTTIYPGYQGGIYVG